jgi:hypothetical protein
MGTTTIRNNIYQVTAPSFIGDECPCDVGADGHTYHDTVDCPESVSPHAIRRGAITHHLRTDTPKTVVSDRCDVSQDVLDCHCNELTEAEKMERRRQYLGDD